MAKSAPPIGEDGEQPWPKRRKLTKQYQTQVQESKSFKRRSETIFRKAGELEECKAQVCVVAYNGPNSNIEVWPKDREMANAIISKFRKAVRNKSMTRSHEVDLSTVLEGRIKELEKNIGLNDKELDKLNGQSLMGLSTFLESKIQKLDETINSIEGKFIADMTLGRQRISNRNLSCKQLQQPSIPLGFNANCSDNPVFMGFEGQTQTRLSAPTATWPCQNYNFRDNNFQFGFANCSNHYMMTRLEGQSDFGTLGSFSSAGHWGISQPESGFGRGNNFNIGLMGLDYRNYVFREQQRSIAFDKADNFGVVPQNQLLNNLHSQQFMAIPQPISSPLNGTLPISLWPQPLQVQMN